MWRCAHQWGDDDNDDDAVDEYDTNAEDDDTDDDDVDDDNSDGDDAADRQADNGGGNDKVITVLTSGPHLNLAGRHPPSQIFDCHHEHDEQDGYDDDEGVLCLYLGSTCTYHTQWGLLVMNVICLWIDDGDTEYGKRFREFVNPYIDGFEGDVMTMAGMIYLG